MKGVSGVIGGVVVILVLLVAVSLTLAAMDYAYGAQQIEAKVFMSQLSQPHVAQVSSDSVMASGRLVASYIIYPDGRAALLNETVSGIKDFQSYLNGNPWAVVVFSNGQWVNVTNAWDTTSNGFGILGTGSYLVPYFPGYIDPTDYVTLASIMYNGTRYNTPLYYQVNATFYLGYNRVGSVDANPTDPLVFSTGRILDVPVTSEDGWLNFTAVSVNGGCVGFAVLIPNTTGVMVGLYFVINPNYFLRHSEYGIYQFINNPALVNISDVYSYIYIPVFEEDNLFVISGSPYTLNPNISYIFTNNSVVSTPIIKVALKFSQGRPVQIYLWGGYYNGSGISWQRIFLPGFDAPTGTMIGFSEPIIKLLSDVIYAYRIVGYYPAKWFNIEPSWPVNIYSEYTTGSWYEGIYGIGIYAEPIDPQLGSDILVVPYTGYQALGLLSGTAIVNVAYSI